MESETAQTLILIPFILISVMVGFLTIHVILVEINHSLDAQYGYEISRAVTNVLINNPGYPLSGSPAILNGIAYSRVLHITSPELNFDLTATDIMYGVIDTTKVDSLRRMDYTVLKRHLGLNDFFDISIHVVDKVFGLEDPIIYSQRVNLPWGDLVSCSFNGRAKVNNEGALVFEVKKNVNTYSRLCSGNQITDQCSEIVGITIREFKDINGDWDTYKKYYKELGDNVYYFSSAGLKYVGDFRQVLFATVPPEKSKEQVWQTSITGMTGIGKVTTDVVEVRTFVNDLTKFYSNEINMAENLNFYVVLNRDDFAKVQYGKFWCSSGGGGCTFATYNLPPVQGHMLIGFTNPYGIDVDSATAYIVYQFENLQPITEQEEIDMTRGYIQVPIAPPKDQWDDIERIVKARKNPYIKLKFSVYVSYNVYGKEYAKTVNGVVKMKVYPVWLADPEDTEIQVGDNKYHGQKYETTVRAAVSSSRRNAMIGCILDPALAQEITFVNVVTEEEIRI